MNAPDWVGRARPVEGATVEVGFFVWEDFYYGPENGFTPEQWETLRAPLYRPALERHGSYVLTRVLADSPGELVRYYADLLRRMDRHGKQAIRQPQYFWLSPLIFSTGELEISFPWHDTWEDAERLLDALEASEDGEVFSGIEQGWELTIFASGERLFIRQCDNTGEEHECVSCDRAGLTRQVPPLRARSGRLLEELRAAFGHDYWSASNPGGVRGYPVAGWTVR